MLMRSIHPRGRAVTKEKPQVVPDGKGVMVKVNSNGVYLIHDGHNTRTVVVDWMQEKRTDGRTDQARVPSSLFVFKNIKHAGGGGKMCFWAGQRNRKHHRKKPTQNDGQKRIWLGTVHQKLSASNVKPTSSHTKNGHWR